MSKKTKNRKFAPERKQPFFTPVKAILKLFHKKPKIIQLPEKVEDTSIFLGNHSAKSGPFVFELYIKKHVVWGASEMLGGYKSRFSYLRNVFYIQKRGWNKFCATIVALFEAVFSPFIYKGLRVLPTFHDARLLSTINTSVECLKKGVPVMIFPEDSNHGYLDVLTKFFGGFTLLAKKYYKSTGNDIPMYPIYYSKKKNVIIIGEPVYYAPLYNSGLSVGEICELMKNKVNELYFDFIQNDKFKQM